MKPQDWQKGNWPLSCDFPLLTPLLGLQTQSRQESGKKITYLFSHEKKCSVLPFSRCCEQRRLTDKSRWALFG